MSQTPLAPQVPAVDVAVVICAYTMDRWNDLGAAVASVEAQSSPPAEVIVVIDHNQELLERSIDAFPNVTVVANRHRQGLSGARNTGWEVATAEVVAFLDDDAAAEPEWLVELAAPYSDPTVMGVGGSIRPAWLGAEPSWFPPEFLWVVGCSYEGLPTGRSTVRNMIGANMSLRRDALDATGGFDSDLGRIGSRPVGCEETEICLRVARAIPGSTIIHEPGAVVHHSVPQARANWSYFRARCYAEGLSKAHVSRLAGRDKALETERSYVLSTLPKGIVRAVADGTIDRRVGTALQAAGILIGLAWTATGYAVGSLHRTAPSTKGPDSDPIAQPTTTY